MREGLLYAGTETGMYYSRNGGKQWHSLQDNLPIVPITDLVVRDDDIVVATLLAGSSQVLLLREKEEGAFDRHALLSRPNPVDALALGRLDRDKAVDLAVSQIERSFGYIGKDPIDLIQVHNLRDIPTQMGVLKELKEEGRVRYIGTTYTGQTRFPDLADAMRNEPLDFIGVNYAVDDRRAADEIFPLAEERGIAILVYVPFGRTRLWQRVGDRAVPEWAAELGIRTWAQFFIKFAAAHPAVTVVTPATSKPPTTSAVQPCSTTSTSSTVGKRSRSQFSPIYTPISTCACES